MLATYGVDVLDPKVSLRRIHVLARRLPPGALPRVAEASWNTEAHLLARLNDAVDLLVWVTARAAGSKMAKPKPLARPSSRTRPGGQRIPWSELAKAIRGANGG